MRLAQRVPDDIGDVFDQPPDLLKTFRVAFVRTGPGFEQEINVTEATNDAVELLEQGFDRAPV